MKKTGTKGLVSFEEVMAALPEKRRRAIEARGAELLAKIDRRMTMVVKLPGQEPLVLVTE